MRSRIIGTSPNPTSISPCPLFAQGWIEDRDGFLLVYAINKRISFTVRLPVELRLWWWQWWPVLVCSDLAATHRRCLSRAVGPPCSHPFPHPKDLPSRHKRRVHNLPVSPVARHDTTPLCTTKQVLEEYATLIRQVKEDVYDETPLVVVGNKKDLEGDRQVQVWMVKRGGGGEWRQATLVASVRVVKCAVSRRSPGCNGCEFLPTSSLVLDRAVASSVAMEETVCFSNPRLSISHLSPPRAG